VDAIEQKPQATQLDLLETKNPASHSLAVGDAKVAFTKPQVFDLLSFLGIKVPAEVSDFDPERFVESLTNEARAFLSSFVAPKQASTDTVELRGREWNPAGNKPVFFVANPTCDRPFVQPTCDRPAVAPMTKEPLVDLTLQTDARPFDEAPFIKRPVTSELIDIDLPDVLQHAVQKPVVFDADAHEVSKAAKPIVFEAPQIPSKRWTFAPIPLTTPVVDPSAQKPVPTIDAARTFADAPVSLSATIAPAFEASAVPQTIEKEIVAALNVAKVVTEQLPKLQVQNAALTERVAASTQITAKPKDAPIVNEAMAQATAKPKDAPEADAKPKIEIETAPKVKIEDELENKPDIDTLDKPSPLIEAKPHKIEHANAKQESIKPQVHAEIRQRIVEQVQELAALHSRQSVTIKLQPEDLGTLTIIVNGTQENVEAKVTASNDAVRHSLAAHRTELVQSIESRGMSLGSFTVGQEQQADTQHGGKANHHNDMRQDFSRAANLAAPRHESAPVYARTTTKGVDTLA
jgi:hypothetical protein